MHIVSLVGQAESISIDHTHYCACNDPLCACTATKWTIILRTVLSNISCKLLDLRHPVLQPHMTGCTLRGDRPTPPPQALHLCLSSATEPSVARRTKGDVSFPAHAIFYAFSASEITKPGQLSQQARAFSFTGSHIMMLLALNRVQSAMLQSGNWGRAVCWQTGSHGGISGGAGPPDRCGCRLENWISRRPIVPCQSTQQTSLSCL